IPPTPFILWTDTALRDFKVVTLDVAEHYWENDEHLIIHTDEVLFEIDELQPTDLVVLHLYFPHYLLPHEAILYTDENGVQMRMFIHESMRGGCYPLFILGEPHEYSEIFP
ncbi:MAG: hypothetical protein LBI27_06295, partial [Clostridiales bacterium]|nr:hypothetical protein [Clostridiales bacterium]